MPYFIPLGIPDFKGKKDRDFIQVSYLIEGNDAVELTIQIRDGGKIIYQEKITDSSKLTKGEHRWKWNGFDSNGIYDSTVFTTAKDLNIYTIAIDNEENYSRKRVEFTAKYSEVKWVDVKINKNTKRIDVTLRVNLKDGGEIGTEKDCTQVGSGQYSSIKTVCPWKKIPEKDIKRNGKPPIKSRTKSFKDLKQLALEGLSYHWGRNKNHFIAKNVDINGELYEVFVNAINTTENAIAPLSTKFVTNGSPGRSRNWELSRILYFNIGYLDFSSWYNLSSDWRYRSLTFATDLFRETSAHEIGHEVLLAYGGHIYSKKHKETSTILQSENAGLKYPSGEIDLMKYFDEVYAPDFRKVIASEKDVLSLIWLTKLELK
ncbi:conserved hypothetical protein [Tenacibaculum maritimum]|uniref:hypothetical protein n=1 Tax=Tenacibaculum maritimum TaxID=107401 RepID=UPI0012E549D5|nr:hypothetical protein [Tenacibaculum maritimum]CAA0209226.1 conserved hypothetical protein [Tenacibaculum maritimum]